MSKLSAVTTGQPTQGMGTVPTAAPAPAPAPAPVRAVPRITPTQQHPSPLQAQLAEARTAEAQANPPAIPPESASINPRDPYSSNRAAATAAWLSLSATELEVRKYFRALPVPSGLEMLAKMRKQCDLAAGELQQRMDEGNIERCTGCGKTLEEVRKTTWIMQGSDVDPDTGVPMPYRFCSPMCVRERNREKMLPPDQRDKKRFDGQEEGDVR